MLQDKDAEGGTIDCIFCNGALVDNIKLRNSHPNVGYEGVEMNGDTIAA